MSDFEDHLIQITLTVIPNDYQHMNVRMSIDSLQYGEQVVARPSVPLEDWQIDAYRRTYNYIQSEKSLITSQRDEEYGTYLLGILFSKPEWRMAFETVLLRPSNKVFLDIKTSDPELLIYPWEICAHVNWGKLGFSFPPNDIVVVRSPVLYHEKWPVSEPVRILVAGSSPYGMASVNFDKEHRSILEGLIASGLFPRQYSVVALRETTLEKLRAVIQQEQPHVVHFITHGESGGHYLEMSDGKPSLVLASQLANVLKGSSSICLFISTASMAMQESSAETTFGIGRLLSSVIPIVIGMQIAISEEAALAFTQEFYFSLGRYFQVIDAFAMARERIRALHPGSPEWIAPMLYRGLSKSPQLFSESIQDEIFDQPIQVFLCHSSKDKPTVRKLFHQIRLAGMKPWLDEINLLPGQDWEAEIKKAVRESDVVIVFLSQESVSKKGFVQKEIRFALDVADEQPDGTIYIIPARLEPCDVPERLHRWHWVDLFEDSGMEKLFAALRKRAKNKEN